MNHVKFGSGTLHEVVFDQHLTPFVATAHEVAASAADNRVGEALLWGNIATGCAAAFGAFGAFGAAGPRAAAFFADAPEPVRAAGQYDDEAQWSRNSCCLWFQIPNDNPFYCEDCPRKPAE